MRGARFAALGAGAIAACASLAPRQPQRLPDGSFRVACDAPLTSCLEPFDRICDSNGYDVVSASERRKRIDLRDVPEVIVSSEAQVRCKPGDPVLGTWPPRSSPAPAAAPPPIVSPPPATAPPLPSPAPAPDGGLPPGSESQEDGLCRGGTGHDPAAGCRE